MAIAEQMGEALRLTAQSVNIKERLDFSCAVFDGQGNLVANAPHMPVHLGSMDRSVETIVREKKGQMRPGDVFMLNAPYNGGTHLPDITVVTPVFDAGGREILFYVASRGPSRGRRRHCSWLHEPARQDHRGGGRLYRLLHAGRGRPLPRGGDAGSLEGRKIPGAQPGAEYRRPQGPSRGQCAGAGGAREDGRGAWARCRARLHGPRPGQCGGGGAPSHLAARGRSLSRRDGRRLGSRGQDHGGPRAADGESGFHRNVSGAWPRTSMHPSR